MAEKQQMQAPSGMAGLVRYADDEKSLIKLKPQHVVAVCIMLVVMEIALYTMFPV
jgi:preprotein translocase subunit Sec61beta